MTILRTSLPLISDDVRGQSAISEFWLSVVVFSTIFVLSFLTHQVICSLRLLLQPCCIHHHAHEAGVTAGRVGVGSGWGRTQKAGWEGGAGLGSGKQGKKSSRKMLQGQAVRDVHPTYFTRALLISVLFWGVDRAVCLWMFVCGGLFVTRQTRQELWGCTFLWDTLRSAAGQRGMLGHSSDEKSFAR